jgi:glycosyltransferase involved in cell wall biosynthesis
MTLSEPIFSWSTDLKDDTQYDVVYIVITYNSGEYLRQTIDSILDQQFDGQWTVLVADDCSTDHTQDIIKEYQSNYSDRIRYRLNQQNLGIAGNWLTAIEYFDTKYVVALGGDDFLIDPEFLKTNFEIMESDPSLSINIFDGYVFKDGEMEKSDIKHSLTEPYTMDIYKWIEMQSPILNAQSLFFRRSSLPRKFTPWMLTSKHEDWFLIFLALQNGRLQMYPRKSTMYRIHPNSYTRTSSSIKNIAGGIELMKNLHAYTDYKYLKWYGNDVWRYEKLSYAYYLNGQKYLAIKTAIKATSIQPRLELLKNWIKMVLIGFKPNT